MPNCVPAHLQLPSPSRAPTRCSRAAASQTRPDVSVVATANAPAGRSRDAVPRHSSPLTTADDTPSCCSRAAVCDGGSSRRLPPSRALSAPPLPLSQELASCSLAALANTSIPLQPLLPHMRSLAETRAPPPFGAAPCMLDRALAHSKLTSTSRALSLLAARLPSNRHNVTAIAAANALAGHSRAGVLLGSSPPIAAHRRQDRPNVSAIAAAHALSHRPGASPIAHPPT